MMNSLKRTLDILLNCNHYGEAIQQESSSLLLNRPKE